MNLDQLRTELAGLADEATVVDVRDRALRTSRRLRRRTAVATGAAVLAVLAVVTGVTVRLGGSGPVRPDIAASVPPPAEITPTVAPPLTVTGDRIRVAGAPYVPERRGAALSVDGDPSTAWESHTYRTRDFGKIKDGMGLLLDLGAEHDVAWVRVALGEAGGSAELRAGDTDPGDATLPGAYPRIGPAMVGYQTTELLFEDPGRHRFLLVWFTELPPSGRLVVSEVTVQGR